MTLRDGKREGGAIPAHERFQEGGENPMQGEEEARVTFSGQKRRAVASLLKKKREGPDS